jgi:hypothetical protein
MQYLSKERSNYYEESKHNMPNLSRSQSFLLISKHLKPIITHRNIISNFNSLQENFQDIEGQKDMSLKFHRNIILLFELRIRDEFNTGPVTSDLVNYFSHGIPDVGVALSNSFEPTKISEDET